MKLYALHHDCGGTVTLDLRIYPDHTIFVAVCSKCGASKEGRSKRKKAEWEGQDHETMRLGGLPERSL